MKHKKIRLHRILISGTVEFLCNEGFQAVSDRTIYLYSVMDIQPYIYEEKMFYGYSLPEGERALGIYGTNINRKLSLKKGETTVIKVGFITENDVADKTYLTFSAIDAPNDNFQNYSVKVKE